MNVIKDLFASKKFVAALLGVVSAVGIRLGLPEAQISEIIALISPILAYIGAQGFADAGKERALIAAAQAQVHGLIYGRPEKEDA